MTKSTLVTLIWSVWATLSGQATAQVLCPTWPTEERFFFNVAEVTDRRTGLVWARCSLGQSWNGNECTGTPSTFTHEQALQHSAGLSGWRLPNRRELASLIDRGCKYPAIDSFAFPATPNSRYWTSSPTVGDSSYAVSVDFGRGHVGSTTGRSSSHFVRLVRSRQ